MLLIDPPALRAGAKKEDLISVLGWFLYNSASKCPPTPDVNHYPSTLADRMFDNSPVFSFNFGWAEARHEYRAE